MTKGSMRMQKSVGAVLLSTLLVSGCAGGGLFPAPKSPAQAVFELDATYNAALTVAVAYKNLPPCGVVLICSDPAIKAKLIQADDVAEPSLKAAEAAVRTPGFGSDKVQTAIVAAQNAVALLTALTVTLKTH